MPPGTVGWLGIKGVLAARGRRQVFADHLPSTRVKFSTERIELLLRDSVRRHKCVGWIKSNWLNSWHLNRVSRD